MDRIRQKLTTKDQKLNGRKLQEKLKIVSTWLMNVPKVGI